jgi:hypothetical protein
MILYVCILYSNLKPMKTITTVLKEKWFVVGIFCCYMQYMMMTLGFKF